jgi:TetR/AcrR family tetracycline transcriptional repressor
VALDRHHIVAAGLVILRDHGLAGLSMRRLAAELNVAPGALYWHIASKQQLLVALAEAILTVPAPGAEEPSDIRLAAHWLRSALLSVRDGADVVSFAYALEPERLPAITRLRDIFAARLPEQQAEWAAQALTHFVLGAVAKQQNQAELVRASIVPNAVDEQTVLAGFEFGVEAILAGVGRVARHRA